MKRKNFVTVILLVILFCLTVNVIVNNIYYAMAFIIYCTFLSSFGVVMCVITKKSHNKYMRELEIETQNIIKNIT